MDLARLNIKVVKGIIEVASSNLVRLSQSHRHRSKNLLELPSVAAIGRARSSNCLRAPGLPRPICRLAAQRMPVVSVVGPLLG